MKLLLVLSFMLGHMTVAINIHVRREKSYDTVFWNGDCHKLEARHNVLGEEKVCICQKRINVNGRTSDLDGTFYQNMGASPSCLYNYRAIGNNFVLNNLLDRITVIDDQSSRKKMHLIRGRSSWFHRSNPISIKEIRMYNFSKDKPFTKIASNIFQLTNRSIDARNPKRYPRHQFYFIQVNAVAMRKFRGHLMQIVFEYEHKHHGIHENIGFAIVKVVGDATYNLDLKSLDQTNLTSRPPQSRKDVKDCVHCKSKAASIALGAISGILIIIIVVLIVKLRLQDSKWRKERVVAMQKRNEPYTIRNTSMIDQEKENDYKDQPKMDKAHYNLQTVDINSNEHGATGTHQQ